MPVGNYDGQIHRTEVLGSREIKASPNYSYITNGITLDGTKFAAGATLLEGLCLAKNNTTGKYETNPAGGLAGFSNPVVLDQSVKLETNDAGANSDRIVGQVLVRGDVYRGMLISWTQAWEDAVKGAIRVVTSN